MWPKPTSPHDRQSSSAGVLAPVRLLTEVWYQCSMPFAWPKLRKQQSRQPYIKPLSEAIQLIKQNGKGDERICNNSSEERTQQTGCDVATQEQYMVYTESADEGKKLLRQTPRNVSCGMEHHVSEKNAYVTQKSAVVLVSNFWLRPLKIISLKIYRRG